MSVWFLRSLAAVALLIVCAPAQGAQQTCNYDISIAPDYGGVLLGMNVFSARRMFPGSKDLSEAPLENATFNASLGMLELNIRKEQFKGVDELVLGFEQGKLRNIEVHYGPTTPWNTIFEFSEQIGKKLVLPRAWSAPRKEGKRESQVLECRGFLVVVRLDPGEGSILSIVDKSTDK